ncbi:MAG: hypothetical protein U0871_11970 [Gemmataceae bacterium]
MADSKTVTVPPADEVRRQLATALAEVRLLRRLLRLAEDAAETGTLLAPVRGAITAPTQERRAAAHAI